ADLETAQRALTNSAGGGGEAGATVESAIGSDPRARGPARTPQSGNSGGGTQTGGLSVSRGQIRKTIRNAHDSGNRRAACTGAGGGVKKPKSGVHGRPPFPCTVDYRESEAGVKGSLRRAKLRRALDHRLRFPRKITEKRERGALGHPHSQLSHRAT